MVLFSLLLGPAILLILVLGGRAALRGKARGIAPGSPSPVARTGCGLMALLPICAFGGVMVASAGGAIHPPLVTVAAPYVCDGTVETRSQNYSYKPGQQGVAHHIFCTGPDGERRDITLRTVGAAAVYYTLLLFPIVLLLAMIVRRTVRSRIADMSNRVGSQGMADLKAVMAERLRIDADIVRRTGTRRADANEETIENRLQHLQSLRDGGLISEEEYQVKRTEILSSL